MEVLEEKRNGYARIVVRLSMKGLNIIDSSQSLQPQNFKILWQNEEGLES